MNYSRSLMKIALLLLSMSAIWAQGVANLSVSPSSQTLYATGTQQFSALAGGQATSAVSWTLTPNVGSITNAGLYTAPAVIATQQTVTVRATSTIDTTKTATAAVTLGPLQLSISPSSANRSAGQTQQFAATVTRNPNTAVTWAISPNVGSISSEGRYTAPQVINTAQTVTVTATSVADSTKLASAPLNLQVSSIVQNLALSPSSQNLFATGTQQFRALVGEQTTSVTWSINPSVGTISSTGLYTAPVVIPATTVVTVTATSTIDPTRSASAPVTLGPLTMSLSPSSQNLNACGTQEFAARVNRNPNEAVTWTINPSVGSVNANGVYRAPATITAQQVVTVTATSIADPTKSVSSPVTLYVSTGSCATVSVSVSPTTATLYGGQTRQFTATVTGSAPPITKPKNRGPAIAIVAGDTSVSS